MAVILNADTVRHSGEKDTSRGGSLGSRRSTLRGGIDALKRTLLLKKITLANYQQDRHYARIVKATEDFFEKRDSLLQWICSFVWTCFPRNL